MKKYIAWMHEVEDHSGDEVMIQFDDVYEMRQYLKSMQGLLIVTDTYVTEDKHPEKCHIK